RFGLCETELLAKPAAIGRHAQQSKCRRSDAEAPAKGKRSGERDGCRHAVEAGNADVHGDSLGIVERKERGDRRGDDEQADKKYSTQRGHFNVSWRPRSDPEPRRGVTSRPRAAAGILLGRTTLKRRPAAVSTTAAGGSFHGTLRQPPV